MVITHGTEKSPRYYFIKAKTAPWNVSLRLICQLSVSPNHLRPPPGQPSTTGGCWRWHMLKAETNRRQSVCVCACNLCHFGYTHTPAWLLSRTHEGVCLHLHAGLSVHVWVCRVQTYGWACVCMYTRGLIVVEVILMLMHFYLCIFISSLCGEKNHLHCSLHTSVVEVSLKRCANRSAASEWKINIPWSNFITADYHWVKRRTVNSSSQATTVT